MQAIRRLYTGFAQAMRRLCAGYVQTGYAQAIHRLYQAIPGYMQAIHRLYTTLKFELGQGNEHSNKRGYPTSFKVDCFDGQISCLR